MGNWDLGEKHCLEACKLTDELIRTDHSMEFSMARAQHLATLAKLISHRHRYSEAIKLYDVALRIMQQVDSKSPIYPRLVLTAARSHAELGDVDKCQEMCDTVVKLVKRLPQNDMARQAAAVLARAKAVKAQGKKPEELTMPESKDAYQPLFVNLPVWMVSALQVF